MGRPSGARTPPACPVVPRQLTVQPVSTVHTQTPGPAQEQPHLEFWLQSFIAELETWERSQSLEFGPGLGRVWLRKGP